MLQIKVLAGFWTFWIYPKPFGLEQSILINTDSPKYSKQDFALSGLAEKPNSQAQLRTVWTLSGSMLLNLRVRGRVKQTLGPCLPFY